LHPEIAEFAGYAKRKGLTDVYFNTNAMLLDDEMSRKLIDAGLDRISVSFEGYTKEYYEANRPGAKFETVLSNIEKMQALKKKLGVFHPKVRVQAVILPDIQDKLEEYKSFWLARADEISYLDYKEMKKRKLGVKYGWACPQIWQRMAIWWDGMILPCNHDDDGWLSLGNVGSISIKDAWQSELLNSIRNAHKNGMSHEIRSCDGCYLRDSEIDKLVKRGNIS